jgi:transposase
MKPITLTRHEFSSSELFGLAKKERRPWIRRRIQAIAAVETGTMSREAIARKFATDSDQVRIWMRRYNAGGLAGLEDKPGKGAKRRLSKRQETALKKALEKTPGKAGIATTLWSGRAVRDYLKKRSWFSCSIAEAYVLLHRLGFTLQRPGRNPIEADPKAEARFLQELRGKKSGAS